MRRIILALTLLALTFVIVPKAFAAESDWMYVDSSDSGTRLYARKADLMAGRPSDTAARLWIRSESGNDSSTVYRRGMTLYVVNCVAQTYRVLNSTFFLPSGKAETAHPDYTTRVIVPGTNLALVTDVLCSGPDEDTADYR